MVTLPGLDSYTSDQLAHARRASPAFARYERLLVDPACPSLHARRHRAWCECVLATLFETASTETVCAYWSDTADVLLRETWAACGLEAETGAVLVALGKHGARELNLSSDIDVMIVAEPADAAIVEKGLRKFRAALDRPGEWGFCYRLDFDLRPGGKLGPLMTSAAQFEDYYWSQGETWERLALVRLRAIAGPGEAIEKLAQRFSFRKFLDFTLLDDLKALRAQVHAKAFVRKPDELNLKLEVGGIRDVELFVHSLLVLNGGKLPELRTRSTGAALDRLRERGLLAATEADFLKDSYWRLRHAENLVQAVDDRQTHALARPVPTELTERMARVDQIVSSLLGQVDLEKASLPEDQNAWLASLNFGDVRETWEQLIGATALSHKNDRDERARREFLHAFVTELAKYPDRDRGLSILLDFVRATRGKATFFSLLLRTPRLIEDLARLFALSPYLGSILAARPELLDHFILQTDEPWARDTATLLEQMSERKLLTELWAANQWLADGDTRAVCERITRTADEIAARLLESLREEYPGAGLEIVALGKWGGRELGLRSDLDFIFVTPAAPTDDDFKVARRFISRLVYDVDLRLRPSGQSGPLLVARDKLLAYWREQAQAWERQAYTRARALSQPLPLADLVAKPLTRDDLAELARIRGKLLKPNATELDVKHAPGGLIDIEFTAQIEHLVRRVAPPQPGTLEMLAHLGWGDLGETYLRLRRFEQTLQLASARKIGAVTLEHPAFVKAASLLGRPPREVWDELYALLRESRARLNVLDATGLQYE